MAATTSSSARDALRAKLFSGETSKPKTKDVIFFGQKIELHQPPVRLILAMKNDPDADRASQMIDMVVKYAYVPGTDELVFDDSDKDTLLGMPFGGDFTRLSTAIAELTDIDFLGEKAAKNLLGTPSGSIASISPTS